MNSAVSDHESLTLGYYWRPTKIGTSTVSGALR